MKRARRKPRSLFAFAQICTRTTTEEVTGNFHTALAFGGPMNRFVHDVARAALATTMLIAAACGGRQTMASRSATAYAEAQKKGEVAVAQEHAHHSVTTTEPEMSGMDHSTTNHADHSAMTHADHAQMRHADHAQTQHGVSAPPASLTLGVPRANSEIARVTPSTTLQPDAFDAPAAAAIAEASKTHEHHQ